MAMVRIRKLAFLTVSLLSVAALAPISCAAQGAAAMPTSSTRYATDAYPGFDREEEIVASGKKDPRWFSWINGPAKDSAKDQLEYARDCAARESWRKARRAYDALVREWPASPEAPVAQQALAELCLVRFKDYEAAFTEYKYLLDYYSASCDFDAMAAKMYEAAKLMKKAGKRFMFCRFANTVDVRRAFEAVVLRAPGASYAPEAMMTVAGLREDECEWEKAVLVYENLRSLFGHEPEAKEALHREGRARMNLVREHGYNRDRCTDTIGFLRQALASGPDAAAKADFERWLQETVALVEDEAYAAARFYDSRTRTRRSAINAYERFLAEHPASVHAEEARARLTELQQEGE